METLIFIDHLEQNQNPNIQNMISPKSNCLNKDFIFDPKDLKISNRAEQPFNEDDFLSEEESPDYWILQSYKDKSEKNLIIEEKNFN